MIKTATKLFLLMVVITGIAYPFLITAIGQLMMPFLANGSLLHHDHRIVGSRLIAQNMKQDKYFWPRPSAINYDPLKPSGGSNLSPASKALQKIVEHRKQYYGLEAPADLLYASGSGLDPHISVEAALYQLPRVAKARNMNESELKALIETHSLGFLYRGYVNVLLLNLKLDERDVRRG